jgi:capsular polysaccharide biosynthesis protein
MNTNGFSGNGNGHSTNGKGHSANGNGYSANGNGHASYGNGYSTNGNGHAANGNGHLTSANGNGHAVNGNGHARNGNAYPPYGIGHVSDELAEHLRRMLGNSHLTTIHTAAGPSTTGNGQPNVPVASADGGARNGNGGGRIFTKYGYWPDGAMRPPRKGQGGGNPYLQFALRWWKLMVPVLIIGLIASAGYAKVAPKSYESTTLIMIPMPAGSGDTYGSASVTRSAAQNYAAQAASPYVLEMASDALQEKYRISPRQLAQMQQSKDIQILSVPGGNLMRIVVSDRDPVKAQTISGTIAQVFVDYVNGRAGSGAEDRAKLIDQRIAQVTQNLVTAELYEREAALVRSLQNDRSTYLQVQANYRRDLADQSEMRTLAATASAGVTLSPSQEQRLRELTAVASTARAQSLNTMIEQQQRSEQTVAELRDKLAAARAELTALLETFEPSSAASVVDQQRRRDLESKETELTRALADQRANLLRLQSSYQQEMAREAGLAAGAGSPSASQSSGGSAEERAAALAELRSQVDDLTKRRDETRAALDRIPPDSEISTIGTAWLVVPTPGVGAYDPQGLSQQQIAAQRQQHAEQVRSNQAREAELTRQLRDLDDRLLQLRQQLARQQAEADRQAATSAAATQQGAAQANSEAATQARAEQLKVIELIRQQRDDTARAITTNEQQLSEVRTALAALPAGSTPAALQGYQEQQLRDVQAREQQLRTALDTEEGRLVQYKQNISAEIIRGADADQQRASAEFSAANSRAASQPRPEDTRALARLAQETAAMRQEALAVTAQVQEELARNITLENAQLLEIREQIEALPVKMDPVAASVLANAYRTQLGTLTGDRVSLELNAQAAANPLELYGGASEALPTPGAEKKALMLGIAMSLAASLGAGGVGELLRRLSPAPARAPP